MLLRFFNKMKQDTLFRGKLFLCLSFVFNGLYAGFLFVTSQIYSSNWFFVMAIYYALLTVARIYLFWRIARQKKAEGGLKTMRACGCFLLLINLVVSVMIFLLIYTKREVVYHEITVITLATYTFATLTAAIIGTVKLTGKTEYIFFSVKQVSLISASVSMVTLTNTMLATFGDGDGWLRSIILPILSAVVSAFIVISAIFLIRKANARLRELKNGKEGQ